MMSQGLTFDPALMEVISRNMHIPERLSVGPQQQWQNGDGEDTSSVYTMQVPDRLTYSETPDMNVGALFNPPGSMISTTGPSGEMFCREVQHIQKSPIRRSYSDQSFGKTLPDTPSPRKQALALPSSPSRSRASGLPVRSSSPQSQNHTRTEPIAASSSSSYLSPHGLVQAARHLGQRASQRLLQMVNQKYRFNDHEKPAPPPAQSRVKPRVSAPALVDRSQKRVICSPAEEGGDAVEMIFLSRQIVKMTERMDELERHNSERRRSEVVLFSLVVSACLFNAWLWIHR